MFQAIRQFGYGGKQRIQGEVFARLDLRNDERLLELKYVKDVPDKAKGEPYEHCDQCSRDFVNRHYYEAHLLEVHGPQLPGPATPTKLEEAFPGGLIQDMQTGAVRAGRA